MHSHVATERVAIFNSSAPATARAIETTANDPAEGRVSSAPATSPRPNWVRFVNGGAPAKTGATESVPNRILSAPHPINPRKLSPNAPPKPHARTSISSAPATSPRQNWLRFVNRGALAKTGAAESVPDRISSAPDPLTHCKLSPKAPLQFHMHFSIPSAPATSPPRIGFVSQKTERPATTESLPPAFHRHPSVSTPCSPVDSWRSSAAGCIGTRLRP